MTAKKEPRGIRNNNCLNIRIGPSQWLGKLPREKNTDGAFEQFVTPTYGIRAGARLILTHYKRGANTVLKLVAIWAPPHENDTKQYASAVANAVGVGENACVDFSRYEVMRPAIEAMIRIENGTMPYPPAVIDAGLELAGIRKPVAPGS